MASTQEVPEPLHQTGRSRKGCKCPGPCFYCGESLKGRRHDHDHFPIPWRHGGRETVPACRRCHRLKDLSSLARWSPAALNAAESGMSRRADWTLAFLISGLTYRDEPYWVGDTLEQVRALVVSTVRDECSTAEARIAMAMAFNAVFDVYGVEGGEAYEWGSDAAA